MRTLPYSYNLCTPQLFSIVDALRTVARETPRILAIAEMLSPVLCTRLAVAFCSSVWAGGCPFWFLWPWLFAVRLWCVQI